MRASALLAVLVLLGGAACAREKVAADGKAVRSGRFRLRTFPPGARVWIDGELKVEATPATLVLEAGRYRLRIQGPGAEAIEQEIEVEAGEAKELTLNIPKAPDARIAVVSDVVGADVRINGYRRGATPLGGVITKPGPIDLTVTTPDGRARSVRGSLAIGEQKTIEVLFEEIACKEEDEREAEPVLESRPPPIGYLTLGTSPEGEVLDGDGRSLGQTPITRRAMAPGTHELILRSLDGRYEKKITLDIDRDQSAVFRFQFRDEDQVPGWHPKDAG